MVQLTTVNNPEGIVVLSNRLLNDWIKIMTNSATFAALR